MFTIDLPKLDHESLACLAFILQDDTTALDHEAPRLARSLMTGVRHELHGRELQQRTSPLPLAVEDPTPDLEAVITWCEQVLSRSRGAGGFEDLTGLLNELADGLRNELRRRRAH